MRITKIVVAAALFGLIAAPALAATQIYSWAADNRITSPTAGGGYTLFPQGTWEGAHSRVLLDPTGSGGDPLLVSFLVQSQLVNVFDCLNTSGVVGCEVAIFSQTLAEGAGAGNLPGTIVGSGDSNLGGDRVTFPDAAVTVLFPPAGPSQGQYCSASIDPIANPSPSPGDLSTIAAYCATILGLTQDAWSTSLTLINPISPNNAGEWHFSADYSAYEIPNSYRYFEVVGAENVIYGHYDYSSGSTPRALPVPLAPMAALALGGSLAYMGMTTLRRKS